MHGPNWLRCAFQIGCALLVHEDEENGQAFGAVMKWLNCPPPGQLPIWEGRCQHQGVGRGNSHTSTSSP